MNSINPKNIRAGDIVTMKVSATPSRKEFTVTGEVYSPLYSNVLYVGGYSVMGDADVRTREILDHQPKNPEWWSWPLIQYNGHLYALDMVSNSSRPFHAHGFAYCGCSEWGLGSIYHSRTAIIPSPGDITQMHIVEA